MIVGFIVNPIAGMGGSVGLKGTDGEDALAAAVGKGATKSAPARAVAALESIKSGKRDIEFITCAGDMGKDELDSAGLQSRAVYEPSSRTTRADTIAGAGAFLQEGAQLIIFVGGDGTARDVMDGVDQKVAVIGVPAGVKMHSAVFLNTPDDLGEVIIRFSQSRMTRDAEVMDVDEHAARAGVASARLYGIARIPDDPSGMQSTKTAYHSGGADEEAAEIAQYVADTMKVDVLYIVGPGSTTAAIARAIGAEKTLLGVDVFLDKKLLRKDADEAALLDILTSQKKAVVIVSPIGSQGFLLGRGNQQISRRVLEKVGPENVVVVATPTKLIGTPILRVDTGDKSLDERLRGRTKVITGYKRKKLVTVR